MTFNQNTSVKTIKSLAEIDQIDKSELWQFIRKPEENESSSAEVGDLAMLWQAAQEEARQEAIQAKTKLNFARFLPKFT